MRKLSKQALLHKYFETCKETGIHPSPTAAKTFITNKTKTTYAYMPFSGSEFKKLRSEFGFRKCKRTKRNQITYTKTPVEQPKLITNCNFLLIETEKQHLHSYEPYSTIEDITTAFQRKQDENKQAFAFVRIPTKTKEILDY